MDVVSPPPLNHFNETVCPRLRTSSSQSIGSSVGCVVAGSRALEFDAAVGYRRLFGEIERESARR